MLILHIYFLVDTIGRNFNPCLKNLENLIKGMPARIHEKQIIPDQWSISGLMCYIPRAWHNAIAAP